MKRTTIALALLTMLSAANASAETTLEAVKARGVLNCGVSANLQGFSKPDAQGVFHGMDTDICRGIAAAIFGDASKVRFITNAPTQRFAALQSGAIDVLLHTVTRTYSRDTTLGLIFTGTYFYDGQGFLVPKALNVTSAKELDGASVCIQPGSDAAAAVADYFRNNAMEFQSVATESHDAVVAALDAGRCDVFTTDVSGLAPLKTNVLRNPDDWVILPDIISKSPFSPVVRQGDDQWLTLVRWVVNAVIDAEDLGIDSKTALDPNVASESTEVRRMRGLEGEMGKPFGLPNDWPAKVVAAIGNYDELYSRNLDDLGLPRSGLNRSWRAGGMIFAPSFR